MKKIALFALVILISIAGCVPAVAQTPGLEPEIKAPVVVLAPPTPSDTSSDVPAQDEKTSLQNSILEGKEPTSATLDSSVLLTTWDRKRDGHMLTPVDPLTGQSIPNYEPIFLGKSFIHAFSPDGRWLALALSISNRDDYRDAVLHLIDLHAWTDVETPVTFNTWLYALRFSPDGTRLIAALPPQAYQAEDETRLQWFDVASHTLLAESTLPFAVRKITFSASGNRLVAYGVFSDQPNDVNPEARAGLVSLPDLTFAWQATLPGLLDGIYGEEPSNSNGEFLWYSPAVVFAPDGRTLYAVHPDANKLTTVDFAAQTVTTVDIAPKLSWLDRFFALTAGVAHAKSLDVTTKQAVLSPDGTKLYVVGETSDTWQDGLQVIDAETGTELARLDSEATNGNSVSAIKISPDGKWLYLSGWSEQTVWTDVVDAASLEQFVHLTGRWLMPGLRLDGEPVLLSETTSHADTSTQTTLAALDPSTLEELHVWPVSNSPAGWLVNENPPAPNEVSNETAVLPKNPPDTCPVTLPPKPRFVPPPNYPTYPPSPGEFWYGSDDLWLPLPSNGAWGQLLYGDKMFWWRNGYSGPDEPQPELSVSARRLDVEMPVVEIGPPATNALHPSFGDWAMLIGVQLPSTGCWEITGHYKEQKLSFVVWVVP